MRAELLHLEPHLPLKYATVVTCPDMHHPLSHVMADIVIIMNHDVLPN